MELSFLQLKLIYSVRRSTNSQRAQTKLRTAKRNSMRLWGRWRQQSQTQEKNLVISLPLWTGLRLCQTNSVRVTDFGLSDLVAHPTILKNGKPTTRNLWMQSNVDRTEVKLVLVVGVGGTRKRTQWKTLPTTNVQL